MMTEETFVRARDLHKRIATLEKANNYLKADAASCGLQTCFTDFLPEDVLESIKTAIRNYTTDELEKARKEFSEL